MYLDLSCPVATKPPISTWPPEWTHQDHNGAGAAETQADNREYTRRRYLETLFLPDILAPLRLLTTDLLKAQPESIAPLLLSLSEVEHRHRKVLAPVLHNLIVEVKDETPQGLAEDEYQVIYTAIKLRIECRAVVEGNVKVVPRKIVEELERREWVKFFTSNSFG